MKRYTNCVNCNDLSKLRNLAFKDKISPLTAFSRDNSVGVLRSQ